MACPHCQEEHPTSGYFCPKQGFPVALSPGPQGRPILDGKYQLIRAVGEGAMGMVYVVRHQRLEKHFALKLLRPDLMSSAEMRLRFEQEARAASGIGHPHIVEVTDLGQSPEGFLYLVMEMLTGRTLADALDEGKFEPARAIDITCQILDGLEAAHAQRVVHRDLKPENVFLCSRFDREDFVKVLDFGIARCFDDRKALRLTQTGLVMGTPHYMAPEQARGKEADHRVDVYATGVMLYEMLTAEQPFVGTNYNAVMMEVIKGDYPRPREVAPDISEALEVVVLRAMALDSRRRYQSAQEFREALEALAEEIPMGEEGNARAQPASPSAGDEASIALGATVGVERAAVPTAVQTAADDITGKRPQWEFPSTTSLETQPWDADALQPDLPAPPRARAGELPPLLPDIPDEGAPSPRAPRLAPVDEVSPPAGPELWQEPAPEAAPIRRGPGIRGPTTAGVWTPPRRRTSGRRYLIWLGAIVAAAALFHPVLRLYRHYVAGETPRGGDPEATLPIVLEITPADAVVLLDGVKVRKAPLVVPRDGRVHHLVVSAPGHATREVAFVANEPQRITVELQPEGRRPPRRR